MRITRIRNPNFSFALAPWYIENGKSWWQIGSELHQRLKTDPENTFCILITHGGRFKGFLVAYIEDNYVWVWQARAKSGFKYSHIVFEGLKSWSRAKGCDKLRMSCSENLQRFFKRKYGFKPYDEEMMREI